MVFADLPPQPPMSPAAEAYAAFCFAHTAQAQARTRCVLDIPFGADYWQKLDLYLPHDPGVTGVPTLLFMHGGYWTHGYKEWLGFMAPALVSLPALFISVGYRLSPAVKHPAALDDCLTALTWAYHHVAAYGGDPQRLFVGGHSAGGHLAALLALQPALRTARGLPAEVMKACFPVSGVYDLAGDVPQDSLQAFLEPAAHRAQASPLHYASGNQTPFLRFPGPLRPGLHHGSGLAQGASTCGAAGDPGGGSFSEQYVGRRPGVYLGATRARLDAAVLEVGGVL
jgi:acetyl esterase/lipase